MIKEAQMRDLRAPRVRDISGIARLFGIDDVLIAAGISAAGSILGGAKSSGAAKSAAAASQYAADQTAAVQREAMQLAQQNTATSRAAGDLSTNALAARFGLIPTGGTVTSPGNIYSMGAETTAPTTGQAGNIYNGGVPYSATQQAGQPDYNAILAERPDVAAAVNDPNGGFNGGTVQERTADWLTRYGRPSGYQAPTISAGQASQAAPVTDVQLSPAAQVSSYARPTDMQAPGVYVPNVYTAPTYTRPDYTPQLDVSMEAFKDSPEYQAALYDINRQSGAAASALAATGGLQSGAALKRLQEIGQDNTVKYYGDFRDATTGQYNTDRNRFDANYNFDTNLDSGNKLAYTQLGQQDRQFGAGFNQANYQYGQNRADNIFNLDRAYGTDLALGNRAYETSRYDTQTGNLFNLANLGQGAAAQSNTAAQNYANSTSQNLFSNAANQGNAALTSAAQFNSLLGSGIGALTYALGNRSNTTAKV